MRQNLARSVRRLLVPHFPVWDRTAWAVLSRGPRQGAGRVLVPLPVVAQDRRLRRR